MTEERQEVIAAALRYQASRWVTGILRYFPQAEKPWSLVRIPGET